MERDMRKSCYDGWYLITKFFVENYDKDFVLEIFQSNRMARELLKDELYDRAKQYYSTLQTPEESLK